METIVFWTSVFLSMQDKANGLWNNGKNFQHFFAILNNNYIVEKNSMYRRKVIGDRLNSLLQETCLHDTSINYCVVPEIYSFLGGSRNLRPILNIMEKRYLVRN